MNPLAKYTLARLVIFVAVLAVVSYAGAGLAFAILISAVVSALLSYVLLRGMRDEAALRVQQRIQDRLAAANDPAQSARRRRRLEDDAIEDAAADAIRAQQPGAATGGSAAGGSAAGGSAGQGQADPEQR